MRTIAVISSLVVGMATLAASETAEAQCNSLPCSAATSSSNTAFSITNNGTGRAIEGRGTSGIGVIGIGNARGVVGTQGVTSCAGTYAIGGCATTGDGILGRSPNRAVIGVQGGGSCAGTYGLGGCATTGDGVVGRSRDGLAGRFEGRVLVGTLQIVGGSDLAEPFDIRDATSIRPGMVVSIDPERPGHLRIADTAYDSTVAGIVSGANGVSPGLTMGQPADVEDGSFPVALTGRTYALADAGNGSIAPGDLLTTSEIPGHAMKVIDHTKAQGAIIGKAMTSLKGGRGTVLVLVSLQ